MTNLLKERYKARLIDNRRLFLAESILKEDFNQETVDKALQAIKQLNSIKWPAELKSFKNATKNAISELKNVLANGGRDKKLIDKIISLFKKENDNPFLDVMAYANTLYGFFPTITKFVDALSAGRDDELFNQNKPINTIHDIIVNSKEDESAFKKIVIQGLKPSGMMAKVQTNWYDKYMKVSPDIITQEILKLDPEQLNDFSSHLTQQLTGTQNVASKIASLEKQITGDSLLEPHEYLEKQEPSVKSEPATPTTATKASGPKNIKPGHQTVQADLDKITALAEPKFKEIGVGSHAKDIIDIMNNLGVLKSK